MNNNNGDFNDFLAQMANNGDMSNILNNLSGMMQSENQNQNQNQNNKNISKSNKNDDEDTDDDEDDDFDDLLYNLLTNENEEPFPNVLSRIEDKMGKIGECFEKQNAFKKICEHFSK